MDVFAHKLWQQLLMAGATEEKTLRDAQMRKEQYKQDLLKQIAEQQEKKMK